MSEEATSRERGFAQSAVNASCRWASKQEGAGLTGARKARLERTSAPLVDQLAEVAQAAKESGPDTDDGGFRQSIASMLWEIAAERTR